MKAHPPADYISVLARLARLAAGDAPNDQDLICLMIVFHTHRFSFARPILPEKPNVRELAPLTQRDAATVVALAYPSITASQLYWLYNSDGPFEVMDDVPAGLVSRVSMLKSAMLLHPDIVAVDPED